MRLPSVENATSRVQWPTSRQAGHHRLRRAGRPQIAGAIGKADDAVGVRDIDVSRARPWRPKGDAEGLIKALGEGVECRRLARVAAAQDADAAGLALGDEDVAARRHSDQARVVEAARQELDGKAGWRLRPRAGGARHDGRAAMGARGRIGRRHVRGRDLAPHSRRVALPIAVSGGTGQDRRRLAGCRGRGDGEQGRRDKSLQVC